MAVLDEATVKEFAKLISDQMQDRPQWWEIVTTLAIAIVASALGSYLASYFKERGKQKAEERRFEKALAEMERQTRAAENIRNEIKSQFDDKAVMEKLYREKLEASLAGLVNLSDWFEANRKLAEEGKSPPGFGGPIVTITSLHHIYFRDCDETFGNFLDGFKLFINWTLDHANEVIAATNAKRAVNHDLAGFKTTSSTFFAATGLYRDDLLEKYGATAGLLSHRKGDGVLTAG